MNAILELEDPTLQSPNSTRKVGRSLVKKNIEPVFSAVSLYSFLDVNDLFKEFSARLCRVAEVNLIRLENSSLDIALERRCSGNSSFSGDFMLRYSLDYEGESLGTLIVNRNYQFLSAELRCINRFVDSLKGPLRNAVKYLRVWQSAYHDALTGVRNRASLDLLLSGAEEGSDRVTSLMVCDVDRFKSINDRYGHSTGDEVLCEFARLLTVNAGPAGNVYRYGGDEFVVVFRRSLADGGASIAEQIRRAVMENVLPVDGQQLSVTTTIGLTQVSGCEALDEAFLRADSALFNGKRTSRNVVVCT